MKDEISIQRYRLLHPAIRDDVFRLISDAEFNLGNYIAVRIVQGLRTIEEQNALYAIGRSLKGANARPGKPMGDKVTNAKGGQSFHNYGLAIDFAILYDKDKNGTFESLSWDLVADMDKDGLSDWKEVVETFIKAGFTWGGNWHSLKDNPHIEKNFGYDEDCHELFAKYINQDFIPGTKYVNL